MCLQVKRKKYVYLSMCSCCNGVSRFATAVKKHMQTDHPQVPAKLMQKLAIPIRVEKRYARNIARSLDKKKSVENDEAQTLKTFTSKDDNGSAKIIESMQKSAFKETISKGSSILCTICNRKFEGLVSYFNHMSAQNHRNVKICFKCTECYCLFPSIKELLLHNRIHTDKKDLSIFKLDCVSATESKVNVTQCPYCASLVDNMEQLYLHIGDKHFTCLDITKIKVDSGEDAENQEEETDILSYKCKHCRDSLHALGDFLEHVFTKHQAHKLQTARVPRKRRLPKWLSDDIYKDSVKKSKLVKSDQAEMLEKGIADKAKGEKVKETRKGEESKRKLFNEEETKQNVGYGSGLSAVVMVKRIDVGTEESLSGCRSNRQFKSALNQATDPDNVKKKDNECNSQRKDSEHTDLGYSEGEKIETKSVSTTNKGDKGKLESKRGGKVQRKSKAASDRSPGTSNVSDDEDFAGDSDDDYMDEIEFGRSTELKQKHTPEKFRCQYCSSAEYIHKRSLYKHLKVKHPTEYAKSVVSNTVQGSPGEAEDDLTFADDADEGNDSEIGENISPDKTGLICEICSCGNYRSMKSLKDHIRGKHPGIELVDMKKEDKIANVAETDTAMTANKFKCPFCEFYLYHREYIFSHIQKVHPEIEHFTAGDIVKETIRLRQGEVLAHRECFQCPDCYYISRWKSNLLHHIRYKHSDKPPIKQLPCILPVCDQEKDAASAKLNCPSCKIIVKGKDTLEKHMEVHVGGEPCKIQYSSSLLEPDVIRKPCRKLISFLCPYCDFVFTRKDSLKSHKCSENPDIEKFIPVIKCVLMKPVSDTDDERRSTNIEHTESIKLESEDINEQNGDTQNFHQKVDKSFSSPVEEVWLRNGLYICPLCDNFRTFSKDEAVEHVEVNHENKVRDDDLLYILEAFLDGMDADGDNYEERYSVRCKYCDFSSDNLTDTLRHTKKHENNAECRDIVLDGQDTGKEGTIKIATLAVGNVITDNVHPQGSVKKSASSKDSKRRATSVKEKEIMSRYRDIKVKGEKDVGVGSDHVVSVVKYKCPYCAFYLHHKEYVYSHMQKAHPEVEHFSSGDVVKETLNLKECEVNRECFKCPCCAFVSKWKNMLVHHFRSNHSARQLGKVPCILPVPGVEKDVSGEAATCPVCMTIFAGKDVLGKHMVEHLSGKPCTPQLHSSLPEPAPLPKPVRKLLSWLCPYCDFVFTRKDSVKSHLSTHLEDTSQQKAPIIKCLLVKPTSTASVTETPNIKKFEKIMVDNTIILIEQNTSVQDNQKTTDTQVSQTQLKTGTYICPICDNFKTVSKDHAAIHMEVNHKNKLHEVDMVYVVEALFERKKDGFVITCASCDYSADNLTDVVRHVRTLHTDSRNDNIESKGALEKVNVKPRARLSIENPSPNSLFEIISLPNPAIESAEELNLCWQCEPKKLCNTRKYLRQHMARNHKDKDMCDVNLVLNEMMNSLDGLPVKGYKCTLCLEEKEQESELVQHFKDLHPDTVSEIGHQLTSDLNAAGTVCEICHARSSDSVSLRKHLLLHINKHRTHCPTCGIFFETSEEVASHSFSVHSKSSQMCNICGKIFMKNKDFLRHMRGHKLGGDSSKTRALCQHCGTDVQKHSFKRHMLRFHAVHLTCNCEICTKQVVNVGKKPVKCKPCNVLFCTTFMLNAHNRRTHPKISIHKDSHSNGIKECRCLKCDLVFESLTQLHSHRCRGGIDHMSNSAQYEMSDSEYDVGEKISADISADAINASYLELSVNSNFPYSCRLCHKSFRVKKYLYNHVRRQHADNESKRFRCKVCKMSFDRINALRRHCKFHIGLRPHQCQICKRRFKTTSHMKEHTRIHTDKLNPRLTCRYCHRKFIQNGALMAHVMYHCKVKPFICPYCERGFASSGELRRHMDRYLDDKTTAADKHVCSYCRKQFPNKIYLIKHFYKHGPENPFHCPICPKRFPSFQQMYTHKTKSNHFTIEEVEEAKAELFTSTGNFKPHEERRQLWNKRKLKGEIYTETDVATSVINKGLEPQGQEQSEAIFDQGYVEVEISNSVEEGIDASTKESLTLFENNILQSMFEIDKTESDSEDESRQVVVKYDQDQLNCVIAEMSDYQVPSAVAVEESTKQNESFNVESETENINDLATIVAQNIQSQETGQTQVYQTPDGSVIHVCVIKSNK